MDDDRDLSGVKVLKLFPLPGVVLFPHAVLPLHIFEERYKEMTEDALASDRLMTVVMLRPEDEWKGKGSPRYEEYGCVGRILKYERLEDGRFNFLLLGLGRVRLTREVPSGKRYRASEFEAIDDLAMEGRGETEAQKAGAPPGSSRALPGAATGGSIRTWRRSSRLRCRPGPWPTILSHALPMPVELKQDFLAERQGQRSASTNCVAGSAPATRAITTSPPSARLPPAVQHQLTPGAARFEGPRGIEDDGGSLTRNTSPVSS